MKKLMLVAAAAAMTGVAQAKLCDVEAIAESCSVYNVKFTFKTLAAKKACAEGAKWLIRRPNFGQAVWYRTTAAQDRAAQRIAGQGVTVEAIDYIRTTWCTGADNRLVYWMDNATRKFEGILWQCEAACFEGAAPWDNNVINNGRINFALWERKSQLALTLPIFQAKIGVPNDNANGFENNAFQSIYFSADEQFNFDFLGRYGKSAQKVGAYWRPTLRAGRIVAAGFGSFDAKNLRIKSISGNAVGMIAPLNDGNVDTCGNRDRFFCAVGFMCMEWRDWCCDGCYAGVEFVPASGTWSIKYNASATKKANSDKVLLTDLAPNYMFYATARDWAVQRDLDPNLHADGCYWIALQGTPGAAVPVAEGALFYKGGTTAEAEVTLDEALNNAAAKANTVFSIARDAVWYVDADTETYGYLMDGVQIVDEETGVITGTKWDMYKADANGVMLLDEETGDFDAVLKKYDPETDTYEGGVDILFDEDPS